MPYRMKDVADRAGISVTTVSHVLNKTRHVAPETRQRVLEVIRELGFYKNAHARRLARGNSDFYGLIVSDIRNPFFPEVITSFENAALEKGFDLLLCNTNYDPARTQAAVRKMIENKVRGVAVMTSELPRNLAADLAANQVAVVFLDMGSVEPYISNIRVDYARGIRQAIHYLSELGHRDFAFIAGPQNLCSAVARREAFLAALRRRGIADYRVIEGNHKVDGAVAAVRTLLAERRLATAILCSNDLTAIGALSTLQQAGRQVPRDVSVVGFDDIDFASLAYPPLTTISLPRDRLGKLAFEALQKMLRSERRLGAEYVVETRLVVRQTTTRALSAQQEAPPSELLSTHGR